ncbi:MAG: hypothetical protein U5N56_03935 [Candidatus Marinimicrobia bacterium]|nr:hypothetical protein [Candidatus Neomarinimicrobiota bacterium]
MSHFTTLVKTEYLKRKSSYWLPLWIVLAVTVLILVLVLTTAIANLESIQLGLLNMNFDYEDIRGGVTAAAYGMSMFAAFIFTLFMIINAQNSLSRESELGCELFYRCQPVNTWAYTAVKYLMHVYATTVLLLGAGIVLALIIAVFSWASVGGFYPGAALHGMFLGLVAFIKICLVFGSLYYLFSALFRNNAFIKGTAALGVIELMFYMIEKLFRNTIELPDIFPALFSLLGNLNFESGLSLRYALWDYRLLLALVFAGTCFALASLHYKYRTNKV